MNRRSTRLLAATALMLLIVGVVQAQPEPVRNAEQIQFVGGGSDVFRGLLHFAGVKPAAWHEIQEVDDYSDLIVVVLGPSRGKFDALPGKLGSVLRRGGAVLVATDTPMNFAKQLPRTTGLGVDGLSIFADGSQPGTFLPEHLSCPLAVPYTRDDFNIPANQRVPELDLFAGLPRVATNAPSFLLIGGYTGEAKYPLARFHEGVSIPNQFKRAPLAIGGSGPDRDSNSPYRFLAIADQSIFINQMLVEPEIDNLKFAARVVTFLQDGGREKRTRCLFIEDGKEVDRFDTVDFLFAPPPLPPLPIPSLAGLQDKIVDFGNQLIDKAQENDLANKLLLGPPENEELRNRRLRALLTVALVLGSVWAVVWTLRRVWKARQPTDLPQPPLPGGRATAAGPAGIVDRRQKELLRRNNLYEPVRDLIREFFEAAGAPPDHGVKLPRVTIDIRVVRRPDTLKKALVDLWKIAYGPPSHVSVPKWGVLEPLFVRAQKAFADGKWQFVRAEEVG